MTHIFSEFTTTQNTTITYMFGLLLILTLLDNHHILNFC